jgi:hypothetical protein
MYYRVNCVVGHVPSFQKDMGLGHLKKCSKILLTFNPNKDPAQEAAKQQVHGDREPTESGNTGP